MPLGRCARQPLVTECPLGTRCPGRKDKGVCDLLTKLAVWRATALDDQTKRMGSAVDEIKRLLPLVAACPDRGSVLPVSIQAECGCGELSECRAGKGNYPGRVTLQDCIDCRRVATSLDLSLKLSP